MLVSKAGTATTTPAFHSQVIVVGAGVVGLAITRALAKAGKEVLLLEKESHICTETSSRNSEVIHAGLYYPQDSAKARLCVQGKQSLYEYCQERGITHRNCGKLIVATNQDQLSDHLPSLNEKAHRNGVTDIRILSREDVRVLEPQVECFGGLLSPSTGIVDSHSFYVNLLTDCEDNGATLALRSKVHDATAIDNKVCLKIDGDWLSADTIINCAGLYSHEIAAKIHKQDNTWQPPKQYFAKGNYFRLDGKSPFQHLIYPVPEPGGLGIHATIDWSGTGTKFGPNVEWLDPETLPQEINYDPNPNSKEKFVAAIQKYYPSLPEDRLQPDYVGVRPKLSHPSICPEIAFNDFCIVERGLSNSRLFHLFGIESPGLTSSLGIAESIREKLSNE